jgi:hypothetical protein
VSIKALLKQRQTKFMSNLIDRLIQLILLIKNFLCFMYNFCFWFFNLYRVLIKFILKVGVEESIVKAPLVRLQSKNANNTRSEVRCKQLIRDL